MHYFSRLLVLTLPLAAVSVASATPLSAGGSVTAAPITSSGSVVAQYSNVNFTSQAPAGMAPSFSGTYNAWVYRDTNNTLCGSMGECLSFALQVTNASSSIDNLLRVTAGPFSNAYTYNVGYQSVPGGIAPVTIQDNVYGTIAFNLAMSGVAPGMSSDIFVIQSSATNFGSGSASWIGMQSSTVSAFTPATAVTPEPSSLVLLGTGLLSAATVFRRRFVL